VEVEAMHTGEPHSGGLANRLNWLRAGVLGANDGIVSVSAIAVGVAGATPQLGPILAASVAGLVGGATSMALGEYVSVSSQRDSERALIAKEQDELATMPGEELAELTKLYQDKGLSPQTARRVAEELTANDALAAHLDAELNIDQEDIVSPWRAAFASAVAFLIGGVLPILAIIVFPDTMRVPATFVAVLLALGGAIALAATFLIGRLLGTTVLA
jgi:vacuolar iron transporter family protein